MTILIGFHNHACRDDDDDFLSDDSFMPGKLVQYHPTHPRHHEIHHCEKVYQFN